MKVDIIQVRCPECGTVQQFRDWAAFYKRYPFGVVLCPDDGSICDPPQEVKVERR